AISSPATPAATCSAAAARARSRNARARAERSGAARSARQKSTVTKKVLHQTVEIDSGHAVGPRIADMADIEIAQLGDRLSDEEVVQLAGALEELGVASLPKADDGTALTVGDVDDDIMSEFLDRLDAHDIAAEIY